jgi:BMFP domain-containing protein YqiC
MYKNLNNFKNLPENIIEEKKKQLKNIFETKKQEIKKDIENQLNDYIKKQLDTIFGR